MMQQSRKLIPSALASLAVALAVVVAGTHPACAQDAAGAGGTQILVRCLDCRRQAVGIAAAPAAAVGRVLAGAAAVAGAAAGSILVEAARRPQGDALGSCPVRTGRPSLAGGSRHQSQ